MTGTAPPTHGRLRRARRRLADGPAIVPAMGIALVSSAVMTCARVAFGREADAGLLLGTRTTPAHVSGARRVTAS